MLMCDIFTARIRRMGKVLFSQMCVCQQGERVVPCSLAYGPKTFPRGGGTLLTGSWSLVPVYLWGVTPVRS